MHAGSIAIIVLFLTAFGCPCRPEDVGEVDCKHDPSLCPHDSGGDAIDGGATTCAAGSIKGRVCAPDQRTWVNGASVSVDAADCHGQAVHVATTSGADGSFTLDGVPAGRRTVHVESGLFTQDSEVEVIAGRETAIPDNQLCVIQGSVKIAVITADGDNIGSLLARLSLQFTEYAGDENNWAAGAAPFFSNLDEMKRYDIIFINCDAAKSRYKIDFGPNAALIGQNLRDYVAQGGSLYATDWALLFAVYAQPGKLHFMMHNGGEPETPLDPMNLLGAPQTIAADLTDQGLAAFLGKTQLSIDFPERSCKHWGLMGSVEADVSVLIRAPSVETCATTEYACDREGQPVSDVPLVVEIKAPATNGREGRVIYTSFHNKSQSGSDVEKILTYIIFHL